MKFYKSIISITLLAIMVMFASCSADSYWDKLPITGEEKYSFDQKEQTYSVSGTENLTEIQVPITRNTTQGSSTISINSEFSHDVFSGPSEVTFADGSNTTFYTIAVGNIQVSTPYTITLSFAKDKVSISGNDATSIKLSKSYNWVAAGSVQFYTSWSGNIDKDGKLVGAGIKVDVEKADGGNGLYRLMSPYYYSGTAAGATGVTLKKGSHVQFTVDATNGDATGFPLTTQAMGEASADDGNYYFAYTPGQNNCSFTNDQNTYHTNALIGYDGGGSSVSIGWYETVVFIWNVDYPWK